MSLIKSGRVDKRVRIDVLEVVLRGAAPGERRCDGCRRPGFELRECRIPYSTEGGGRMKVYWRDFCSDCIAAVCAAPALPFGSGKEKLDAAWEKLLERLKPLPSRNDPDGGRSEFESHRVSKDIPAAKSPQKQPRVGGVQR